MTQGMTPQMWLTQTSTGRRTLARMVPASVFQAMTGHEHPSTVIRREDSERRLTALTREYNAWNRAQGLRLGSADEHVNDENLTDSQRNWLRSFMRRWNAAR